ncbi:peptidoglycan-binding domain-containing protein [Nocardia carnea]|uniref:peptidoglycan-binding domain-containing protein n=1 Tax=Nocardia carnea TaxID=37328 RepID=UPI002458AC0A|nr:peptidoglycan-binding domain-containing protein [Nocardia carnea]
MTPDGKFGPETRSALIASQRSIGTSADGSFGPDTGDYMKWMFTNRGGCDRLCRPSRQRWASR